MPWVQQARIEGLAKDGSMGSQVVSLPFQSQILADNSAGDPCQRDVLVYLPPGYEDEPMRRYPSVYVLAAYLGDALGLLHERRFSPGLQTRLDELIASGAMEPAIVVLPDCFSRYGGSQYMNSVGTGRYEDYLIDEIIPFVDSQVRTTPEVGARGVLGNSSGGYGALRLSMRRPGVFSSVASMSGDAYFEYCYLPEFPRACGLIQPHGSVEGFLAYWRGLPNREGKEVTALNIVAMAACYSPDPDASGSVLLPFELDSGKIKSDIWEQWLTHDPVRMLDTHLDALGSLNWLHLECGVRDEYNLQYGARILSGRLSAEGINHSHEEFSGGHRGLKYRYDFVIPRMVEALSS